MKFSELEYSTKKELFYACGFDDFRDEQANKIINEKFKMIAQFLLETTGIVVRLDEHGNLNFTPTDEQTHKPSKKLMELVENDYKKVINECNEEFGHYSEEYDALLDKYCEENNLNIEELLEEPFSPTM